MENRPQSMSFIERLSSLRRLKCTSIMEKSMSFIERLSSLQRLKCTSIIEKGPQSMSFRLSIIRGSVYIAMRLLS